MIAQRNCKHSLVSACVCFCSSFLSQTASFLPPIYEEAYNLKVLPNSQLPGSCGYLGFHFSSETDYRSVLSVETLQIILISCTFEGFEIQKNWKKLNYCCLSRSRGLQYEHKNRTILISMIKVHGLLEWACITLHSLQEVFLRPVILL